jgi:hypothetical protein
MSNKRPLKYLYDYLASKGDDDEVGFPCDNDRCILANAMAHAGYKECIVDMGTIGWVEDGFDASRETTAQEDTIIHAFDLFPGDRPVAKKQWLDACPVQLKKGHADDLLNYRGEEAAGGDT